MFYGNVKEDACGNNASCCSSMDEAKDNSQQSFTMIDCCEDFTNYAVISVSFISQQIEKFSTNIFLNETNFLSNYQKLIDNSFNKIHVKPPGILKFPVSYIISFIIHSTDIGSELPA
ncbi:MAG: hypothetical protein A2X61_06940 [Ignavibacteria bacterium GWB2_35_12]|nr:MAG: hypothetical protein A2X61_06940 [Ignavibacteria bacterium GWB2_35_12]OGU93836.1 MAG: hypothetical protein A2220_11805 [Ignavibacteria bacterium RIFOXYA2_FULL_35_10]OGV22044.1 MAG: hypothetical protein A2475_09440 [Ignavibacteria bacterium RIFOXYC2_FULL_35_21]